MEDEIDSLEVHPLGDLEWLVDGRSETAHLDTYGGRFQVEWDPSAEVTAFGPLSYFIHFLKTSGLWDEWVELCPRRFTSNNAPSKQKILGTVLLSILAGHKRYAHITTVRSDKVLPEHRSWAIRLLPCGRFLRGFTVYRSNSLFEFRRKIGKTVRVRPSRSVPVSPEIWLA